MSKGTIIAIDFDGTCVSHEYPHMGMDIGAVPVLRELTEQGCRLILYTMRSGSLLKEAKAWFAENKIPLYAVNENPEQKSWTASPKVYANFYIDDAAIGCPLKFEDGRPQPFVDWVKMRELLIRDGILYE
jgi:hypothetical protein